MLVERNTLHEAWTDALEATYERDEVSPLVVTMHGFSGTLPEDLGVRDAVDSLLSTKKGVWRVETTASTIFPNSMWKPGTPRADLYRRYSVLFERRLRRVPANRRGTYFYRLINYGDSHLNQLEAIIATWEKKIRRRSAFVASVFDPALDHKPTPFLGFPCLHQVCFAPDGSEGFSVTGFYAKQDIAERGYGNYLGLARLGSFVADAFGRDLTRVTCVASVAGLSQRFRKGELEPLVRSLGAK